MYINCVAPKIKSYVSKQILLFVDASSIVGPCKFCYASMKILLCIHTNEWQRQFYLAKTQNLSSMSLLYLSLRSVFAIV